MTILSKNTVNVLRIGLGTMFAPIILHWLYIFWWSYRRKLPPLVGIPLPLIGNLLLLKSDDVAEEFQRLWFKKHNGIFSFWFGKNLAVIFNEPAIDHELQVTRVDKTNARPKTEAERFINYHKGKCEGIHSAEGEQWKKVRNVLTNDLLRKSVLESTFLPKIHQEARELTAYLFNMDGQVIAPRLLLKVTAMNTSLKTILNVGLSYDDLGTYDIASDSWSKYGRPEFEKSGLSKASQTAFFFFRYIDTLFECLAAPNVRDIFPWPLSMLVPAPPVFQKFKRLADEREEIWNSIIEDHKAKLDRDKPRDWLDILLIDDRGLTRAELVGLLMDTVVATSDTFIALIEWMLAMGAAHPDIQQKIQQELDRVVGQDTLVEAAHQDKCVYFNAFMKEIMRRYPLTPINPPRRATADTTLGGYDVPEGTWIFQHWGSMHTREDLWNDPDTFNPDRFLNEESETGNIAMSSTLAPKSPVKFNMFAYGKRSCPGYRLGRVSAFTQGALLFQCFTIENAGDSDFSARTRLITFPKKLRVKMTYRLKTPLFQLLQKQASNEGAWF